MSRGNGSGTMLAEREPAGISTELMEYRETPSALEAVTRAEIDVQIATAKRFPRSLQAFRDKACAMVALDADLAAQCTYYLPARSGKKNDPPITGPSVRLAEIVAVCWGNLRVVGRIVNDDGKYVTAQGIALDLEANVGYAVEVQRGVTRKDGSRYGDDMIKTTCNAAIAIATRNATFKAVPRAFVSLIEEEAQRVARGEIKTLPDRTARALAWFAGKGIEEPRVFAALELPGREDMTLDALAKLNGFKVALQEDPSRADEFFPPPEPQGKPRVVNGGTKAEQAAQELGKTFGPRESADVATTPEATQDAAPPPTFEAVARGCADRTGKALADVLARLVDAGLASKRLPSVPKNRGETMRALAQIHASDPEWIAGELSKIKPTETSEDAGVDIDGDPDRP